MEEIAKLFEAFGLKWEIKSYKETLEDRINDSIFRRFPLEKKDENRLKLLLEENKKSIFVELFYVNGSMKIVDPEKFKEKTGCSDLIEKIPLQILKSGELKYDMLSHLFWYQFDTQTEEKIKERLACFFYPKYGVEKIFQPKQAEKKARLKIAEEIEEFNSTINTKKLTEMILFEMFPLYLKHVLHNKTQKTVY